MKIFKFCAAIAMTVALMTAQPVFGATGHAAGNVSDGPNIQQGPNTQQGPDQDGNAVPETGSTFALLFLSFFALMGATRLASFRQRKRKVV